jgi:PAS domain S-box-containing protein
MMFAAAIIVPIVTLSALAWLTWRESWSGAESEIRRSADAAAEYALRVIDSQRLAAEYANDLIRGLSDAEVRAKEAALSEALRAKLASLPLVQTIAVSDRDGFMLVAANIFPVPRDVSVADREWVAALRAPDAPPIHISRVYVGRFDGLLFYGLTRRRTGSGNGLSRDAYDGAINVSINPNTVAAGFMAVTGEDSDVTALVRSDGQVLVRTPGFPTPLPEIPADSPLRPAAAIGELRGTYMGKTLGFDPDRAGEGRLIAFRRVSPELPLYVTVARPTPVILARWRESVLRQFAVGIPASLALIGLAWLALRRTEAALSAEQREAANARFRGVFESQAIGMVIFDANTGETLEANDRFLGMTGADRAAFEAGTWDWRPVTPAEYLPLDERAIAEARGRGWWEPYEKEYRRPDGTRLPVRISSAPLPGEPGRVVVLVQDISEQREAEFRRDLLMREVDHRAKNALAIVQAAIRLAPKEDAVAYAEAIEGRVRTLARAHDLLAKGQWKNASLRRLLEVELLTFVPANDAGSQGAAPRFLLEGPDIHVSPAAAQAISMLFHELATNAVKYGALSAASGLVVVVWRLDPEGGVLRIRWEERGGPALTAPPARRGFGSRVIENVLRGNLGGQVRQDWRADGLACEIELSLARIVAAAPEAGANRAA